MEKLPNQTNPNQSSPSRARKRAVTAILLDVKSLSVYVLKMIISGHVFKADFLPTNLLLLLLVRETVLWL